MKVKWLGGVCKNTIRGEVIVRPNVRRTSLGAD